MSSRYYRRWVRSVRIVRVNRSISRTREDVSHEGREEEARGMVKSVRSRNLRHFTGTDEYCG